MSEQSWEYLEERLGMRDNDDALERSREIIAQGWEFVGVRFSEGLWLYRRRLLHLGSSELEPRLLRAR
jgi:hypothetical protein